MNMGLHLMTHDVKKNISPIGFSTMSMLDPIMAELMSGEAILFFHKIFPAISIL